MSYLKTLSENFKVYSEAIKLEHSIFALPFAMLTLFIVSEGSPNFATFFWIIIAMVSMRTFGMGTNRIIDKEIDSKNPRTSNRALPKGLISLNQMLFFTSSIFQYIQKNEMKQQWLLSNSKQASD